VQVEEGTVKVLVNNVRWKLGFKETFIIFHIYETHLRELLQRAYLPGTSLFRKG